MRRALVVMQWRCYGEGVVGVGVGVVVLVMRRCSGDDGGGGAMMEGGGGRMSR
ncbi:hypothetical protein HanIR_Chr14g0673741 [Helianthus annuus]|nr:hypothetical protein HanIR_Chr14g0673741 [Helianthus annuus]